MKKLLVLFVVLAFLAPIAPVMADDTLDLSGAVRARAWAISSATWTDDDDDDHDYFDQRFRIQGKINPADGVYAIFRVDLAEDVWGSDNWASVRYSEKSELQVDRAYMDITKGMFNIKAGQQLFVLGNAFYDNNDTGIQVTIKTPISVRFGLVKEDEGGDVTDEDPNEDIDQYFIDLGYKSDDFSLNVFYVMQTSSEDNSQTYKLFQTTPLEDSFEITMDNPEPTMLGVMAKFGLGPANVMAELNMFGGSFEESGSDVDYVGTQLVADANMKFSDMLTAGVQFVYSTGNDDVDDQLKITRFPGAVFGSMYYGDIVVAPFHTDIVPFGDADVFDPVATQSGAMGGTIYAKFMAMEGLTLSGGFTYLQGVEDEEDFMFDSGSVIGVGLDYQITDAATFSLGYLIANASLVDDDVFDPETKTVGVARLQVNF